MDVFDVLAYALVAIAAVVALAFVVIAIIDRRS